MITRQEAERLRSQLLAALAEDARNAERLLARLASITDESGIGAHAALLLILTHLAFEESEARTHWEGILAQRQELSRALGRDAGLRTAMLDYFLNVNRRLVQPTLIDIEMLDALREDSGVDALTGLACDRRFRAALQAELRRARRFHQRAAVVVVDADDFGGINERFGRLVGDRLLRELGLVLGNSVRDIDLAGRTGEDELVLLLPETDRNGALLVAERFRRQAQQFFAGREAGGRPVELTVSAGVACYPDDATTAAELLGCAAQALYQAKAFGRNVVQAYQAERRRFVRFDLDPDRFELEVLGPPQHAGGRALNLSRSGILFTSPEPIDVGEIVEIRLVDEAAGPEARALRVRGTVVRLEQLPRAERARDGVESGPDDGPHYDLGVAIEAGSGAGEQDLLDFLERARGAGPTPA